VQAKAQPSAKGTELAATHNPTLFEIVKENKAEGIWWLPRSVGALNLGLSVTIKAGIAGFSTCRAAA